MEEIRLDGASWRTIDDFYRAHLTAVEAPEWHGKNLDAVWDSSIGGDINKRNPPFRIRITGLFQMSSEARKLVERFKELIDEARAEKCPVEIELSE